MSITCPVCGAWTSVKETRSRKSGVVARRYECANLHRFTTEERIREDELLRQLRELQPRPGLPGPGGEGWAAYEIR